MAVAFPVAAVLPVVVAADIRVPLRRRVALRLSAALRRDHLLARQLRRPVRRHLPYGRPPRRHDQASLAPPVPQPDRQPQRRARVPPKVNCRGFSTSSNPAARRNPAPVRVPVLGELLRSSCRTSRPRGNGPRRPARASPIDRLRGNAPWRGIGRPPVNWQAIDRTASKIDSSSPITATNGATRCAISSGTTTRDTTSGKAIPTRRGGAGIVPIAGLRGA